MNQELQTLAHRYVFEGKAKRSSMVRSAFQQQVKLKMVRTFGHKQTKQAIKNAFEIAELVGLS